MKQKESLGAQCLTLTQNGAYTYSSTLSACLDFFSGVLQTTDEARLYELLEAAWKEESALALKLIFHLRDVRHGKAALIPFHRCLIWLYKHHPNTLIHNLKFVSQYGYWKDLTWLIKFLLEERVAVNSPKPSKIRKSLSWSDNLEELISKRVNGELSREAWKCYLKSLPNDDARRSAKQTFQRIAKEVHLHNSQQAKERKRMAKDEALLKLMEHCTGSEDFNRLYSEVVELFAKALQMDRDAISSGKGLKTEALAAKWAPRIGGSIDNVTSLGKAIARKLYQSRMGEDSASAMDESQFNDRAFAYYRKHYITPLRECIKVPEKFMSANKWDQVDYQRVPSVCMKRNKKNFSKRDAERFNEYLEEVKTGKKKIASGALLPHEIVGQIMKSSREIDEVSSLQWKSYVDNLKKSGTFKSALAVCDVSPSMVGTPMEVAIALSLLTAEVSEPPFNGLICTFSAEPELKYVGQDTLRGKINVIRKMKWGGNTNFQAVFDLILSLAKETKLPPEEMVKTIFVYSDMEFDEAGGRKNYATDYQRIKQKFSEAGYPVPGIVFWNLKGDRSKPVKKTDENVALLSGFSGHMLKTFLEIGELRNPFQVMLACLGNRYDQLLVVD